MLIKIKDNENQTVGSRHKKNNATVAHPTSTITKHREIKGARFRINLAVGKAEPVIVLVLAFNPSTDVVSGLFNVGL